MFDWYRKNLKDFIEYVGEPSKEISRNYILLLMGPIYILLGVLLLFIKGDSIVANLWAKIEGIKVIFVLIFLIGGHFMLVVGLFRLNMVCWKKQHKVVNERKCWLWLKILFWGILPLLYIKRMISYILQESRQMKVVDYIPEIIMAFYIASFLLLHIYFDVIEKLRPFFEMGIRITILLVISAFIFSFFFLSKKFIHISIRWEIWYDKKTELKQTSRKNIKEALKSEEIRNEMKNRCKDKYEIVDEQLKYSNLYFYVFINLLLLCVEVEDTMGHWDIFVNQFMGITTLTALLREVEGKKRTEER